MTRVLRILSVIWLLGTCAEARGERVDAEHYASYHIENLARALGIEPTDSLTATEVGGMPIVIERDRNGRISHIGVRLYDRSQIDAPQADVLRYVERVVMERALHLNVEPTPGVTPASEYDVPFIQADEQYTLRDLPRVAPTMKLGIDTEDDRRMAVHWTDSLGRGVAIAFPINHNYILGYDLDELDALLIDNLLNFSAEEIPADILPTEDDLTPEENFDFLSTHGHTYLVDGLTSTRYFEEYEGEYYVLEDLGYPVHVLANLLTGNDIPSSNNIRLNIVGIEDEIELPLWKLVGLMRKEGCKPYFGITSFENSEMQGIALYHNPLLGYCHVLKITFDERMLINYRGLCHGQLVSYVPISKVLSLFDN